MKSPGPELPDLDLSWNIWALRRRAGGAGRGGPSLGPGWVGLVCRLGAGASSLPPLPSSPAPLTAPALASPQLFSQGWRRPAWGGRSGMAPWKGSTQSPSPSGTPSPAPSEPRSSATSSVASPPTSPPAGPPPGGSPGHPLLLPALLRFLSVYFSLPLCCQSISVLID